MLLAGTLVFCVVRIIGKEKRLREVEFLKSDIRACQVKFRVGQ